MDNDDILSLAWNTHQSVLMSVFESLLNSETLVDVTLAAEGQFIKAHKIILSACSPYLKMILSEHNENHPIIILNETTFDDLKSMLEYMYKGEVSLKKKDLARFIRSAEALKIRGLARNTVLNQRTVSDEPESSSPTRRKVKITSSDGTRPPTSNDDSSQSAEKETEGNTLLVPKIENISDDEQNDDERNEFEEMEMTEAQVETSEPVEQIVEDETIPNWDQGANESSELQESEYNEHSEGNIKKDCLHISCLNKK